MTQRTEVLISEVRPRDGLQNIIRTMPTADKLGWISAFYGVLILHVKCSWRVCLSSRVTA